MVGWVYIIRVRGGVDFVEYTCTWLRSEGEAKLLGI